MTTQEQIEYLATKVMEWREQDDRHCEYRKWWMDDAKGESMCKQNCSEDHHEMFDPITDWNHWRQVEEKVMEDDHLTDAYIAECCRASENPEFDRRISDMFLRCDLPTRCQALIAAHQSLYPSPL